MLPTCPAPDASTECLPRPGGEAEEWLNAFVDGELPADAHAAFFAHLATCAPCRHQLAALMAFRQAVRVDALALPPAADEAVLARLDALRRTARQAPLRRVDRRADRAPLAQALRRRVSLGAALVALVVVGGLASLAYTPAPAAPAPFPLTPALLPDGALYVIQPGVTVEAPRQSGG